LGAASLELPPDIAVHAILMMLLLTLFVILCVWLLQKSLKLIATQVDYVLTLIWDRLQHSRSLHFVANALKHHDTHKTHGQLTLAFYFIVICILFAALTFQVTSKGS